MPFIFHGISTPGFIAQALADNAPVAIGVSGGADSQAAALATFMHLDGIGHSGPRILVHSDLGLVEWDTSLSKCEELARHLGVELLVLRGNNGGLMERWESRWESSKRRYANLETVTLVLPWSTPKMRFCTSEQKSHRTVAALKKRFGNGTVINVTGVRAEESAARARMSVADTDTVSKSFTIHNWRPILHWKKDAHVFPCIQSAGLDLHEAYTRYGMSRVSCAFCIMSSAADLAAAARHPANSEIYRRMVALESASSFAFQGSRWLADVAPELLSESDQNASVAARVAAAARVEAEKAIPRELLYTKGWPTFIPSLEQAEILARARKTVAAAVGLDVAFTSPECIRERYAELLNISEAKAHVVS